MNTLRRSKMEDIKMNQKRNLFDPTRDYIMGNSALEGKMFQRVSGKETGLKGDYTTSPTSSKPDVK